MLSDDDRTRLDDIETAATEKSGVIAANTRWLCTLVRRLSDELDRRPRRFP